MNNLGFSTDNNHIGDTFIRNGNLTVDKDLIVGGDTKINGNIVIDGDLTVDNLQVNELQIDGYKLPTTKGNAGDIIVATTDGSTSEWQPGFQGTARVVINKFTGTDSRIRTQAENGIILSIEQAGFGSKTYIEDEFPIGSVIVIRAYGNWSYLRSSQGFIPEGSFWLLFSNNPPSGPVLIQLFAPFPELPFAGTYPSSKGQVGNWELNIQITRVSATGVRIGGTIQTSLADSQNQIEIPLIFPQKIAGNPDFFTIPGYPFDVAVKWQDTSSQGGGTAWIYPTLCGYTQDLINAGTKIVATSQSLSGNHLLLGNLNANGPSGYADAGHDLMFLSDGSKPMTGNISMNNNTIFNCDSIETGSGRLDFKTDNSLLISTGQTAGLRETFSNNNIAVNGGGVSMTSTTGDVLIRNISSSPDKVQISSSNGNIELLTQPNGSGDIVLTSNKNVTITSATNGSINMSVPQGNINISAPTGEIELTAGLITRINSILVMEGYEIIGAPKISTTISDLLIAAENNDVILRCGTITSFLDAVIVNIDNTTIANNLNVPSINNITPVGGLSAGTSNSPIVSGTAEQGIAPLTFVGNRSTPGNSFQIGDSFKVKLAGNFNSVNGDTMTIRLKGGLNSLIDLATAIIPLNNSSGTFFNIDVDFNIRQIGPAGVASLITNFTFTYNQTAGGNFQGFQLVDINNTTFNTQIINELDITAQFSSPNPGNSIETVLGVLSKVY